MAEDKKMGRENMFQYLINKIPELEKQIRSDINNERGANLISAREKRLSEMKSTLLEVYGYKYNEGITPRLDYEAHIGFLMYQVYINSCRIKTFKDDQDEFWIKRTQREIDKNKARLLEEGYDYDEEMKIQNSKKEGRDTMATDEKSKKDMPKSASTSKAGKNKEKQTRRYEIKRVSDRLREVEERSGEVAEKIKEDKENDELRKELLLLNKEKKMLIGCKKQETKLKEERILLTAIIKDTDGKYTEQQKKEAIEKRLKVFAQIEEMETEALEKIKKMKEEFEKKDQSESKTKEQPSSKPESSKKEEKAKPKNDKPKSESPKKDQSTKNDSKMTLSPELTKRVQEIEAKIAEKDQELHALYYNYYLTDDCQEVIDKRAEISKLYGEISEIIVEEKKEQERRQIRDIIAEKEQELHVLYYNYYLTDDCQEVIDKRAELNDLYARLSEEEVMPKEEDKPDIASDSLDLTEEELRDLAAISAEIAGHGEDEPPTQEPGEDEPPIQEAGENDSPNSTTKGASNQKPKAVPPIKKENRLVKFGKGFWNIIRHPINSIKKLWEKFWFRPEEYDDEIKEQEDIHTEEEMENEEEKEKVVRTEKSGVRIDYMPDILKNKGRVLEEEDWSVEPVSKKEAKRLEKQKRKEKKRLVAEEKRATKKEEKEEEKEVEKRRRENLVHEGCNILGEKSERFVRDAISEKLLVSQKIITSKGVKFINPDGSITDDPLVVKPEEKVNPWRDDEAAEKVGTKEGVDEIREGAYKDDKSFANVRSEVKIVVDPKFINEESDVEK